jgi:hypothetical protein
MAYVVCCMHGRRQSQVQAGLMTYVLREPLAVDVRQLLADGDRRHQPEVRQPRHLLIALLGASAAHSGRKQGQP